MPEALEIDAVLAQMMPELKGIDFDSDEARSAARRGRLCQQCAGLTDLIQPFLEQEKKLLSREWVGLQVEQELARLACDPGLPPKSERRSTLL
ncbi:MAG: hypothetical protein RIF32_01685 [Leptospirales bacterium]|jgi:hypothetical protein